MGPPDHKKLEIKKRHSLVQQQSELYQRQSPFNRRNLSLVDRPSEVSFLSPSQRKARNQDPFPRTINGCDKVYKQAVTDTSMLQTAREQAKNIFKEATLLGSAGLDSDMTVPKSIKISSKYQDNSIECVRKRLRTNMVNHMKFDAALDTDGKIGQRSFQGVYEPNNPLHVLENRAAKDEPRNYYEYIAKHHPRVYQDKFAAIRPRPKIKKPAKPLSD